MSHTCYGHNRRKNTCFRYKGNPLTYREVKLKDNMENTSFSFWCQPFFFEKRALSSCKGATWAPNKRHLGRVSGLWDGNCKVSDAMKIFAHNNASFVELLVFLYKAKTMFFFLRSQHKTLLFTLLSNNKHYRNFQEDKARFPSDTKTRWRTAFLMPRKFKTAYLPILSRSGQTDLFVTGPVVTGQRDNGTDSQRRKGTQMDTLTPSIFYTSKYFSYGKWAAT